MSDIVPTQEAPTKKIIYTSNAVMTAEYRLLHAIVGDTKWLNDLRVTENLLVHPTAKVIFRALTTLNDLKVKATPYAIFQQAIDQHESISKEAIDVICSYKEEPLESIDDIIQTLSKGSQQLKISQQLDQLSKQINVFDADIDAIGISLFDIQNQYNFLTAGKDSHVMTYSEWLEKYRDEYETRRNVNNPYRFNDSIFDDMIVKGASPGDIGIIFSSTGQGKTTLVTHLFNQLIAAKTPVLFFELEMSSFDMMDRKLASQYQIPFTSLTHPTEESFIENQSFIKLELTKAPDLDNVLGFTDYPYYTLATIKGEIIKFQKRAGQQYCVVFIDLLSMVMDFCKSKNGVNLAQSIELAMNETSRIAKELGVHIIGTVQAGRSADNIKITDFEDIQYCRGTLNDLKNANAYAERARYVVNVFRPIYYAQRYLPDDPRTKEMEDIMTVSVLKQNNGPVGIRHYMCNMSKFHLFAIHKSDGSLDGEKDESIDWSTQMPED